MDAESSYFNFVVLDTEIDGDIDEHLQGIQINEEKDLTEYIASIA